MAVASPPASIRAGAAAPTASALPWRTHICHRSMDRGVRAARALRTFCLAVLLVALAASLAHAEPAFPALTGRVVDNANLLSPEARTRLSAELAALEQQSTDQLVVVTVPTLAGVPIEDYGYQLGRKWGIGQQGKDNGVILLIAPSERKVRIEVGRGLEPTLTDLMSKLIIENAILPAFRRGDFPAGIAAGVRDIKDVLLGDAEAVKARAKGGSTGSEIDYEGLIILGIWLLIVAFVIYVQVKHARRRPTTGRRRGNDSIIVAPGGSGHWDGGWSGGGGGGWSGGGGSFGGGGASGGW